MNKLMGAAWLGATLIAMLVATPVFADEPYLEMRPYVSGLFGYIAEENDRDALIGNDAGAVQEGKGFQLSVGKAINKHFGFEIAGFGHNFSHGPSGRLGMQEYGGKLDGLFFYSRDPRFSPYFGVGLGGMRTDLKGINRTSTDPFADIGVGFMKFFDVSGTELGIRADLRARLVFFDEDAFGGTSQDDVAEAVLKVGLVVPLGSKPKKAEVPPPPPKPTACPDSDGDGVCDAADLCPETPKGLVVDAKGCPPEPKSELGPNRKFEDVHFAFDRADLTDYAKAILDKASGVIAELAKKYPGLKVDVTGHTDWQGTDGYNLGLSERRANTVRQYLLRKGVEAGRINTQAYGESRPKATNETEEGRALNRRSEVMTREK
ncbi:MAG: OmpA family protein [Panacagrimonas sp.]